MLNFTIEYTNQYEFVYVHLSGWNAKYEKLNYVKFTSTVNYLNSIKYSKATVETKDYNI